MTTQTIANQQEKFIIKIDKHIERMVDSVTRKKLTDAYMKLFTGFAWVNWTKKQSLGRAWQNALGQCEGFLTSKNKTNPAIKYLNIVAKSHKTYWSRVIMTNPNSPNTINKTPTEIKQMQQYGEKLIRESMDTINLIIARYNEYIEEITGAEKTSVRTAENKPQNQTAQIPQVKPVQQVQQAQQQIAQPQVATMEKQMPQVKPLVQAQQAPQQIAKPQVATMEKQMPQVKPLPQVQQAPQQIAKLNPVADKQIVQQRINLFIMAKYNQKAA